MKRGIPTNAAAGMFDVVKKLGTSQALDLSLRSSGRFVGNTTVRLAANMDGAAVRVAAIDDALIQNLSASL